MTQTGLIKEILNVISCSKFKASDYGEMGLILKHMVSNWVKNNNVNDVEFIVDKEAVNEIYGVNELKTYTSKHIKFVNGYSEIMALADKLLKDSDGPGWNFCTRDDNRWNSEYLFTGSDCTYYIIIKKIA